MNELTFKIQIGFLAKYYGNKPNDTVYQVLWAALKEYSDSKFEKICQNVIKTFRQTSCTPFPLVANFLDSISDLENNQITYPGRPLYLDHKEELADEKTIAEFRETVKSLSRKLSMPKVNRR